MGVVYALARRMHRTTRAHVDFDDLVSYGAIGLLEAADRFDPSRGVTFCTFAFPRVRGAILDGLRQMSPLPRTLVRRCVADDGAVDLGLAVDGGGAFG
jgi:RNA polymerase sigma factor for flagellar operon FliA